MPFITEEIWQQNKNRKNMIVHEIWPDFPNVFYNDDQSQKEINWLIDLIQEIRSARSEVNIPASLKINLKIVSLNMGEVGVLRVDKWGFMWSFQNLTCPNGQNTQIRFYKYNILNGFFKSKSNLFLTFKVKFPFKPLWFVI